MPSAEEIAQNHDFVRESGIPMLAAAGRCAIHVHRRCFMLVQRSRSSHQNGMSIPLAPARASAWTRIKASFRASFGDIVFGMEDGTVSIFGLVFGVAASTTDSRVVLVAGMTGAIAAAVSMMAGAYLDAETARDQARAARAREAVADPTLFASEPMRGQLIVGGLTPAAVDALDAVARAHPAIPRALRAAFERDRDDAVKPLAHALWMFVADLFAALVPVAAVRAAADRHRALRVDRMHRHRADRARHRPREDRPPAAAADDAADPWHRRGRGYRGGGGGDAVQLRVRPRLRHGSDPGHAPGARTRV